MKRILSYFWPITRFIPSEINGSLELTWVNGRKVLDARNANYSYGSLQRILRFGLAQMNMVGVSQVLLLGLGGGSIIHTLLEEYHFKGKITAVEIDPVMIEIARQEFAISANESLEICVSDAFAFMEHCSDTFDLVIVDLFVNDRVPRQFYSNEFWNLIVRCIHPGKYVLFNAGVNHQGDSEVDALIHAFSSDLKCAKFEDVNGTNTLVVAQKVPVFH